MSVIRYGWADHIQTVLRFWWPTFYLIDKMSVIRKEEPPGCDRLIHIWSCRNIIHLNRRDTVIHIRCRRTSELFQTVAKSYIPTFNLHYPVFFIYPRTGQKGRLSETVKHWLNLLKWKEEIMPEYWQDTQSFTTISHQHQITVISIIIVIVPINIIVMMLT